MTTHSNETIEALQPVTSGEHANTKNRWSKLHSKFQKDDNLDLLINLAKMSPAASALALSLQGRFEGIAFELLVAFMKFAEKVGYNAEKVENWASSTLKNLPLLKA